MKKALTRYVSWLLAMVMVFAFSACKKAGTEADNAAGKKTLSLAANFAYPSLDPHVEYYSWYTQIYGVTESIFKLDDSMNVVPGIAKDAVADETGKVWTVTLNDGVKFSNGSPVTAQVVVDNIKRLAAANERFATYGTFTYAVVNDTTFTVTTPEVYPILKSDMASPEFAVIDLSANDDFSKTVTGTGPFVIKSFIPEGDVVVEKNANYWNGEVKLDEVTFHYMQEDEPKLNAMQSGEIKGYDSVTADAVQIYQKDPSKYNLTSVPGTRLQFYIVNMNAGKPLADANLRAAINGTIDKEAIAAFLNGTVAATASPYKSEAAYGKANGQARIPADQAKALIEQAGYTMGADGFYQKDGQQLNLKICYYAARSLDTLATLMQEQLKAIGVNATLTVEEDPDATYIANPDMFDLALYCMISDKSGDPQYFIDSCFKEGAYYDVGGYSDPAVEAKVTELANTTDPARRAQLANEIIQATIDAGAFGYVGLFNKVTVLAPGITGYANTNPFDFYAINANTDIA